MHPPGIEIQDSTTQHGHITPTASTPDMEIMHYHQCQHICSTTPPLNKVAHPDTDCLPRLPHPPCPPQPPSEKHSIVTQNKLSPLPVARLVRYYYYHGGPIETQKVPDSYAAYMPRSPRDAILLTSSKTRQDSDTGSGYGEQQVDLSCILAGGDY